MCVAFIDIFYSWGRGMIVLLSCVRYRTQHFKKKLTTLIFAELRPENYANGQHAIFNVRFRGYTDLLSILKSQPSTKYFGTEDNRKKIRKPSSSCFSLRTWSTKDWRSSRSSKLRPSSSKTVCRAFCKEKRFNQQVPKNGGQESGSQ